MKHFVLYECCCVNHKAHADYKKEDAYTEPLKNRVCCTHCGKPKDFLNQTKV